MAGAAAACVGASREAGEPPLSAAARLLLRRPLPKAPPSLLPTPSPGEEEEG